MCCIIISGIVRLVRDCIITLAYPSPLKGLLVGATTTVYSYWLSPSTSQGPVFKPWGSTGVLHALFSPPSLPILLFTHSTHPFWTGETERMGGKYTFSKLYVMCQSQGNILKNHTACSYIIYKVILLSPISWLQ